MDKVFFDRLNSPEYSISSKLLKEILSKEKISDDDLTAILSLNNLLTIGDFLQKFKDFSENNLKLIETYINENLDHSDRLFISDLIEFATDWNLSLPYKKCIGFLKKYNDDDTYVQLASIEYVFKNLKFQFIDEIYNSLYAILNNSECNQSNQVMSAFVLFRITAKKEFLIDLLDLVVNGDLDNKVLLKNILALKFNSNEYYEYSSLLKSVTS